jgi:hypothetical protein
MLLTVVLCGGVCVCETVCAMMWGGECEDHKVKFSVQLRRNGYILKNGRAIHEK